MRKKPKQELKSVKETKQAAPLAAHRLHSGRDDGVAVNFPVLHLNTWSHCYHFLHHVCRPVSYRHGGWQQRHSGPITHGPPVIPSSCFLIINIILTYFSGAPHSSEVKQCALSVLGYKHNVTQKKTREQQWRITSFSRMGGWNQWPKSLHRKTSQLAW